jgi:hypothetical protein
MVGASVGITFAVIIGIIIVVILCRKGIITLPMSVRDKLVNLDVGMSSYSPMGAAEGGAKQPDMNFDTLRKEVRSSGPPPTTSYGKAAGYSKQPSGSSSPGGYVPPVLATAYDDDEEEVSLGGFGKNNSRTASV